MSTPPKSRGPGQSGPAVTPTSRPRQRNAAGRPTSAPVSTVEAAPSGPEQEPASQSDAAPALPLLRERKAAEASERASPGIVDSLEWQAPRHAPVPEPTAKLAGRRDPSGGLLGLLGHSQAFIARARGGEILACDCKSSDMDDPAVAVALALHYARQAKTRRVPIPAPVIRMLALRIEEGNAACRAVGDWLDEQGLLDITYPDDGSLQ